MNRMLPPVNGVEYAEDEDRYARCDCGAKVAIPGSTNACGRCPRLYNSFGQEIESGPWAGYGDELWEDVFVGLPDAGW